MNVRIYVKQTVFKPNDASTRDTAASLKLREKKVVDVNFTDEVSKEHVRESL